MTTAIRIAIVDDHPVMRVGVEHTLGREVDFTVIATGGSAQEAIAIASEHTPDIMLLDVNMPGCGLAAARTIRSNQPYIRLLFLTISERHEDVSAALDAGVRGYVLKGISGPDLVRTVRAVALGETYITPEFATRLLTRPKPAATTPDPQLHLSAREEQVLSEVSLGMTNKEIARKLDLTEKTIKHYMSSILHKLSARNRVEAIVAARKIKEDNKKD
jgi:DNA-binding NarL/FixJ family response regulator